MEKVGKRIGEIIELIKEAKKRGLWLVFAGLDFPDGKRQSTEVKMLKKLLPYLTDSQNKTWVAPVGEISTYIRDQRGL